MNMILHWVKQLCKKLIFLTKVLCKIGVDYDYGLYMYGPYSSQLTADFEYLTAVGVLESQFKHYDTFRGYEIRPGSKITTAIGKAEVFIAESNEDLAKIVDKFGRMTA